MVGRRSRCRRTRGKRENGAVEMLVETITLPGLELVLERPRNPEVLVSDEAFAQDEFLPYWAELWASGLALAGYITTAAVRERRVLELGCGLGLPSLAAAACGARVVATDWADDAIRLVQENARRNALVLEAVLCDWRDPGWLDPTAFDLVLAADLVYEERNVAPVGAVLDRVLESGAQVWLADPGRRHAAGLFDALSERYHVVTVSHPALPGGGIRTITGRGG